MDIQNSRDFPITKLKSQKPADDSHKHGEQVMCLSVHGTTVSYAVRFNKTLIDWIFW